MIRFLTDNEEDDSKKEKGSLFGNQNLFLRKNNKAILKKNHSFK